MQSNPTAEIDQLHALARLVRYHCLNQTSTAHSGHLTSSLSAADVMTALLFGGAFRFKIDEPDHPNNDRLIFSKGHASPLLYALWAVAGCITEEELSSYRHFGSRLEGHPTPRFPYVEAATGSLGQGLGVGLGMALNASHLDRLPYRTYVLLGDSEMSEGSQWEAIQLAAYYGASNLIGIIDVNRLGQRGPTMFGHDTDAHARRVAAFGWRTLTIDGHDMAQALDAFREAAMERSQPLMIVARTLKGKGISFLEDAEGWHGKALDEDQWKRASREFADVDREVRGTIAEPEDRRPERASAEPAAAPHYEMGRSVATRNAYGNALIRLQKQFPQMVSLDGEVSNSTMAEKFANGVPERFFEMFVAEQNMVEVALGLSRRGKVPFVSTFAAFFTRAFDQIRMSQYSQANLKFVGSHAGVSIGEDGPSQMGLEDIAMFRSILTSAVLHPCDAVSTEKLVEAAAAHNGMVYMRTMRQSTPVIYDNEESFQIGGSKVLRQSIGDSVTLVAAGVTVHEAIKAHEQLLREGVPVRVIDAYSIKPIDALTLREAADATGAIVTVEDHYPVGGLGDAVLQALADRPVPVTVLAVRKTPMSGGGDELREFEGISASAIINAVRRLISGEDAPRIVVARDDTKEKTTTPPRQLLEYGQSYWLDNLTREMIRNGELARRVSEEGLRGVTSNPALFHKAISKGRDYDDQIERLVRQGLPVAAIYEHLVVSDIQDACDILRPVYEESARRDGYVSLEVSPYLAHDTEESFEEARRLHRLVDRPNVFIKIPGTRAGFAAIEEALFEGININITLLFSIAHYKAVAEAYVRALERRAEAGRALDDVASVASFFLSRIDVLVDRFLAHRIRPSMTEGTRPRPEQLLGKAAIANAKLAYQHLERILRSDRWKRLEERGARVQRLLWASTSTKDPLYDEIRYVAPLIGPHTVNTMPPATIRAFDARGVVAHTVERDLNEARQVMEQLAAVGVDFDSVTWQLENEGIQKFREPFDELMATLAERRQSILEGEVPAQTIREGAVKEPVDSALDAMNDGQFGRRLFAKNPSLWSLDGDEQHAIRERLGWLGSLEGFHSRITDVIAFADRVREGGFTHVVLLGMGGSCLAADVCRDTFGRTTGWPELLVLDSTDPSDIREVERTVDPPHTLFIVASKSGTTIETLSLYRYFWEAASRALSMPGSHFVAITDHATPLAKEAATRGFRRTFENPGDIGGRYSALSYFGLVPMALLGLDVARMLDRALVMQWSCGPFIPAGANPALHLAALLGLAARHGRDKVTWAPSRSLNAFATWAEQLLAESTGKAGRGLVPVAGEPPGSADVYGPDRLFVSIRELADDGATEFLQERSAEGHPVVEITLSDPLDIGAEFLRWEVATAVTGSILGINPFDEPNVAESKKNTTELLEQWNQHRSFREEGPLAADGFTVYAQPSQSWLLPEDVRSSESVLRQFLASARPGDYVALLAYLPRTPSGHESLTSLRLWLRDHLQIATTLGYGPRYLHSTGQLHKGGPNTGLFLLITTDTSEDLVIPGQPYGFSTLQRAQALGDYRALVDKGRRVVRVHVDVDVESGIRHLTDAMRSALPRAAATVP
jgi:transaldolase